MKKTALMKTFLILLPILAVGLATTTDSVTVYDKISGTTEYYSYFSLVPVANLTMLMPLAALLSAAAGVLAAIFMTAKKLWTLKGIRVASFLSATLAAIPILIQGDVVVMPNVGLPLLMLGEFFVASGLRKAGENATEKKKNAPRLKAR